MVHVAAFAGVIMAYAFIHPSATVFATATGGVTTLIGLYHWFTQRDDKIPDCREGKCSESHS